MKITEVTVTPLAVKDPPLLNSVGVHQPFALRSIVEVHTDEGITGLSEAYGDDPTLANLHARAQFGLTTADLGRPFHDLELSFRPADIRSANFENSMVR